MFTYRRLPTVPHVEFLVLQTLVPEGFILDYVKTALKLFTHISTANSIVLLGQFSKAVLLAGILSYVIG